MILIHSCFFFYRKPNQSISFSKEEYRPYLLVMSKLLLQMTRCLLLELIMLLTLTKLYHGATLLTVVTKLDFLKTSALIKQVSY